jgi:two-component system C4-dicarboxylate transport response regulator DctD
MNQSVAPKVIVVEDDNDFRHALVQSFNLHGFDVVEFSNASEALSIINVRDNAVIVSDISMPGMDGLSFLKRVLEIDAAFPVIMITGHGTVDTAVEAMRLGAYDFVEKPFAFERLREDVRRALEKRRLVLENRELRQHVDNLPSISQTIVGTSEAISVLRQSIQSAAEVDVDVLVHGETGVGKELVARALHDFSDRADAPFVALNCGAIPKDMIEAELFGHSAGAFTGAAKKRIGKLVYANGGTVFLDEIESMSADLQVKLLRVIEDRKVQPLGSNDEIPINIRFVAATKVNLLELSDQQKFRQDLYYRLNVCAIIVPALRERLSDIPELIHHFQRQAQTKYRKAPQAISQDVIASFLDYDWPGNVRELRNEVDRLSLGFGVSDAVKSTIQVPISVSSQSGSLNEFVEQSEARFIRSVLEKNNWSITNTFKELGVSRKTLHNKMQRYQIKKQK